MDIKTVTMENILSANLGEERGTIRASFEKKVLIKQYETEVALYESSLDINKPLTGAERLLISSILQIQLEYSAYSDLLHKGLVTNQEFVARKSQLEQELNTMKKKAEDVLGTSMDKYFESTSER